MENSGTAGATSFYQAGYEAKNAFLKPGSGKRYVSYIIRVWPVYIWMKFANPHRISQLGFSSIGTEDYYAPKRFDIVGSSNCATMTDHGPWTVLRHVPDAGFPVYSGQDVFKSWKVPQQKRQAFPCIGLKVERTLAMGQLSLKNIQMWEDVAL